MPSPANGLQIYSGLSNYIELPSAQNPIQDNLDGTIVPDHVVS